MSKYGDKRRKKERKKKIEFSNKQRNLRNKQSSLKLIHHTFLCSGTFFSLKKFQRV
jgi:hypothetical protein